MSIVPIFAAVSVIQHVRYKCEICHERAHVHEGRRSIPKCAVCNSKLCKNCNQFGLCPDHFQNLDEVDKKSAQNLFHQLKEAKSRIKSLFLITLITVIILFALLFFGIFPTTIRMSQSMIFWIISIGLFMFAPVIVINIRIEKEKTLFRSELKKIYIKYQISGVDSSLYPNYKYCNNCKVEFPDGTIFCSHCGDIL